MTCTFFGHRNCSSSISQKLKTTLEDLICNHSVDHFYVGNHGNFDFYTRKVLQKLKEEYPQITYHVVLAYLPQGQNNDPLFRNESTILAEGVETVPRRVAILQRNKWMLEHSDYVIAYITHSFGGAAQFYERAQKKKKICINLAESFS